MTDYGEIAWDDEPRPRHVKLTTHFLHQANERMPREDVLAMWDLLYTGALFEAAQKLDNDNGAISVGSTWIVFCIEARDPRVLVLKTALRASQTHVIQRRADTRVLRLPDLDPRAVEPRGLRVRRTMIGVELETPDSELVLGLTDEEAADLRDALLACDLGDAQNGGYTPPSPGGRPRTHEALDQGDREEAAAAP